MMNRLKDAFLDVNHVFSDGSTPLYRAIQTDDVGKIRDLVAKGADVNAFVDVDVGQLYDVDHLPTGARDIRGKHLLEWAVSLGKVEAASVLLELGASVHVNRTILMQAMGFDDPGSASAYDSNGLRRSASVRLLQVLLASGAGNVSKLFRVELLQHAARWHHCDFLQILVDALGRPESLALSELVWCGPVSLEKLVFLDSLGADLDLPNPNAWGRTALHTAARSADSDCVRFLLERNVRVDPRDNQAETPLTLACSSARCENVAMLLAAGADTGAVCKPLSKQVARLVAAAGGNGQLWSELAPREQSAALAEIQRAASRAVRSRAFVVCVALQDLELPAIQICEILEAASPFARTVPLHIMWAIVTTVKHFHARRRRRS
jgi:ankyrin repeat protein